MKKLFTSFFAAVTLVMSLAIPSYAAEGLPLAEGSPPNLQLYRTLEAAPNSEVVLDSLQAYEENGKYFVRVGKSRPANGQQESYNIEVDYQTGIYSVQNYTPFEATVEVANDPIITKAINNYVATVTAKTLDPVNILCNSSTLKWGWAENTSTTGYPYTANSRSLTWWDAQPTSLGTYWYYSSHSWGGGSDSGQSASVTHVNYNFGGGIAGTTYAEHYISITPEPNGMYHYYVDLQTDGIAGNLLHLSVESN